MINCQYQEVSLIKCLKINCILETIRTTDTKFANKGCKWKIPANNIFFLSGFSSQTLTIHRTAGKGRGPSIPLYHFHPLTNIETFICNFACEMTIKYFNRIACFYQTATRWDLPPYRITIWMIDWWCSVCLFTW